MRQIGFHEMQILRAKGLCFSCNAKYTIDYNCPNKRLLLLRWDDNQLEASDGDFLIDP